MKKNELLRTISGYAATGDGESTAEVVEKYVIPDKNGFCGTKGARIKPDAQQWAKDEYNKWMEIKAEAAVTGFKM